MLIYALHAPIKVQEHFFFSWKRKRRTDKEILRNPGIANPFQLYKIPLPWKSCPFFLRALTLPYFFSLPQYMLEPFYHHGNTLDESRRHPGEDNDDSGISARGQAFRYFVVPSRQLQNAEVVLFVSEGDEVFAKSKRFGGGRGGCRFWTDCGRLWTSVTDWRGRRRLREKSENFYNFSFWLTSTLFPIFLSSWKMFWSNFRPNWADSFHISCSYSKSFSHSCAHFSTGIYRARKIFSVILAKRKVLVAKVAVKLKFQSPNWQMQRNALLVCFWSGYCLIDWFIKAIAASYPRVSVEHYWLLGTFLLFPAGPCPLSVFLRTFFFEFFLFLPLLWPDARDERLCLPIHCGTIEAQTRTEKDSCAWLKCAQTDNQNAYDSSSAQLSSDGLERRSSET